jgi:hypothetical protein
VSSFSEAANQGIEPAEATAIAIHATRICEFSGMTSLAIRFVKQTQFFGAK